MSNGKTVRISFYLGLGKFDPAKEQATFESFRETLLKNPSGIHEFSSCNQEEPVATTARKQLEIFLKEAGIQGQVLWKLSDETEIKENSKFTLTNAYESKAYSKERPYNEHITFPYYLDLEKIDQSNESLMKTLMSAPSGEFRFETAIVSRVTDLAAWNTETTREYENAAKKLVVALKKAGVRGSVLCGAGDWEKIAAGGMSGWTGGYTVPVPMNRPNPFCLDG